MSKIQYLEGINKVDVNNLNEWIKEFIINNKDKLVKEKVTIVTYKDYNIVLYKEMGEYYCLSLIQDKKCYKKDCFNEKANINFKNKFMSQLFIIKKISRGEVIFLRDLNEKKKVNKAGNRCTKTINKDIKTQIQMKTLICNNCIYINTSKKTNLALKCTKRKCKIYDETEAAWCKHYTIKPK